MRVVEAAIMLGVTRRSIYRWIEEGRLAWPLDAEAIAAAPPAPRRRGPQRNPWSVRYMSGRHTFRTYEEERAQ